MLFGAHASISQIRFLGRWSVERSLEHYIQEAMAVQLTNTMDAHDTARVVKLACKCRVFLECPSTSGSQLPPLQSKEPVDFVNFCRSYAAMGCAFH